MNENIKLLIMKAGGIICSDMTTGTIEKIDYLRFDSEKFAELIVRECTELTLDYKSDDYYNGWLDYRDEIKKHFGVEE